MTNCTKPIELIGMMDSPFVRRVAITMTSYGLEFENIPLSVYNQPEQLAKINPLLTVPVIRSANHQLLDSRLILQWIDTLVEHPWNEADTDWQQASAIADFLALKAGEYYREVSLRQASLHCEKAIMRIKSQLTNSIDVLNSMSLFHELPDTDNLNHSLVAISTSYRFVTDLNQALRIGLADSPTLSNWCNTLETNSAFKANFPC